MEIIDRNIENYYIIANILKDKFNNSKFKFIKSVYIHGSFARGEITPKESDINIMVFTKKKEILKTDIEKISKIKEDISKDHNIKIEFKINNLEKNNLKQITTDLFYPYLYDFVLNSFFIYGVRIEEDLLKILKTKTYFEFNFETTSVFSKIRIDFLENYFEDNKYKMVRNLYKYARLLKQLKVSEEKVKKVINSVTDYKNIEKETILKQIMFFEETLEKTDLKKIYENNKNLKINLGFARGGLVYNLKAKKILLLENKNSSCSFWSKPSAKDKKESIEVIKKEIQETTGIENINIVNKKIGECHNWFEEKNNSFNKIHTEYYYATTESEETSLKKDFKWVKINEIKEHISSPCLGYIAKSFYEDFIKKIEKAYVKA